jgi:hypothetical protein
VLNFNFKGEKGNRIPRYLRWFLFIKNRTNNNMKKFYHFNSKPEYDVSKINYDYDIGILSTNKNKDEESFLNKFEIYNNDNYAFFNKLKPVISQHSIKLNDGKK